MISKSKKWLIILVILFFIYKFFIHTTTITFLANFLSPKPIKIRIKKKNTQIDN